MAMTLLVISLKQAQSRKSAFFAISKVGNFFSAQYHVPGVNTLWFGEFKSVKDAEIELDKRERESRVPGTPPPRFFVTDAPHICRQCCKEHKNFLDADVCCAVNWSAQLGCTPL